jgi:hypothetical protein
VFGRPAMLMWHKRRWRCPERLCEAGVDRAAARDLGSEG